MNEIDATKVTGLVQIFSLTKLTLLLFGVVVLGLAVQLVSSIGTSLHTRVPSQRLLIAQAVTTVSFLIYIFGGAYLLYGVLRPPEALLLAASGTLAVALGLSLKDLVASVVAGVILLFDRPFQVGDRITFAGSYGEVKSVGLRAVRIVTLDDSTVTIPNNRFITDVVSSANLGELDMMVEVKFHVGLDVDLQKARELLYETAVTSRYVTLKHPVTLVLSEVSVAQMLAMEINVKCYVLDIRFEKSLQTDLLFRGNMALKSYGIKRPQLL